MMKLALVSKIHRLTQISIFIIVRCVPYWFLSIVFQQAHQGDECLAIQASAASAPRNDVTSNGATSSMVTHELGSDHYNSFAMDELSRMLNMARTGEDNDPNGTSSINSRPIANSRTMSTNTFYGSWSVKSTQI